jgi:hypothetical protein
MKAGEATATKWYKKRHKERHTRGGEVASTQLRIRFTGNLIEQCTQPGQAVVAKNRPHQFEDGYTSDRFVTFPKYSR